MRVAVNVTETIQYRIVVEVDDVEELKQQLDEDDGDTDWLVDACSDDVGRGDFRRVVESVDEDVDDEVDIDLRAEANAD